MKFSLGKRTHICYWIQQYLLKNQNFCNFSIVNPKTNPRIYIFSCWLWMFIPSNLTLCKVRMYSESNDNESLSTTNIKYVRRRKKKWKKKFSHIQYWIIKARYSHKVESLTSFIHFYRYIRPFIHSSSGYNLKVSNVFIINNISTFQMRWMWWFHGSLLI